MSREHQVSTYRKRLVEPGEAREGDVICAFYKIADQQGREPDVDYEFDRAEILRLLRPYAGRTSNPIFIDYLERGRGAREGGRGLEDPPQSREVISFKRHVINNDYSVIV